MRSVDNIKADKAFSSRIITYCILIFSITMNIISVFHSFLIITPFGPVKISCFASSIWFLSNYAFNKISIQISYFLRLQIAFKDTIFEVNKYLIIALYIASIIYFFVIIIAISISDPNDTYWDEQYSYCNSKSNSTNSLFYTIAAILVLILELFTSIAPLILFLKPICKLQKMSNVNSMDFIFKIALLNLIMIISSIVFQVVFTVTVASIFLLMDNVINSLCTVLMIDVHEGLYKKLCCTQFCVKHKDDMKNMEMEIQNTPTETISN